MDLRHQLAGLRSSVPLLVASAVLAGGLAFLVSGILPKTYEAKSTLIIGQSLSAVNPDYSQLLASQQLSNTYVQIATNRQQLVNVINSLHLTDTPEQLARRVDAASAINSTLLSITATDPDPAMAAAIANGLAAELVKASPDLAGQEADIRAFVAEDLKSTQSQIEATQAEIDRLTAQATRTPEEEAQLNVLQGRLTTLRSSYASLLAFASNDAANLVSIVDPAVALADPISPRPLLNTLLAAILSLLLVTLIIVIATYFDDSLKDAEDVQEVVGLATLGTIPRMPMQRGRSEFYQLVTLLYPRSAAAESFRTLRTNLEFASVDAPVRTLLVTSPRPGEGKTVSAANLAVAFAQAGKRVLLVDADFRKPGVHAMFNLPNTRGLSSMLRTDDVRPESAVQGTEQENLRVLTTGPLPPNPAELLGSKRLRVVLDRLGESNDLLIIDSPPLLVVTDAAVLSSFLDGTLLVIHSKRTRRDAARQAREALAKAGARVLGTMLNGLPVKDFAAYGEYYGAGAGEKADAGLTPGPETSQPGSAR